MLIGVDFDNTIVCYDHLMHSFAVERGWIPQDASPTKQAIREHLRSSGNEERWTELQGFVYGQLILQATPFPGVLEFFTKCRSQRVETVIISHRTPLPFRGPQVNLHHAARGWLKAFGFFDTDGIGLHEECVSFEETREQKLSRIKSAGCSCFIDDLPEFLDQPMFPAGVQRILFDPHAGHLGRLDFGRVHSWMEISELFLSD
jgi:hypothetical protein